MSCEDEHFQSHPHSHSHDGEEGHSHIAPTPTSESLSLHSKIDTDHVTALNLQNPPSELSKVFRIPSEKYRLKPVIKLDCDAQLIINIPFINSHVKLYSIILRTNGTKYCPKTIKLWKNDPSIDFDNVELKKPLFIISHPLVGVNYDDDDDDEMPDSLESDSEFVEHYLPRHVFTGVQHLTVFLENIHDDEEDECHLHYIELRGESTELTKDPVISIYELAPNPADHKNIMAQESGGFSLGN
ncbi:DUF1000-domain-containing protein [Hyphopichia burtonii NRRL Y-1933]|uniref:DUF1000-domain-containing protein n=1 Tax=Hyphopichia burtonii NRRL Y-1933 TaxID=984485 RepID=A0A1E4RMA3_9ASCO|nr:DUF1000-domain-containing protein [Hyphopichia burtonii NRRL Y-1933]ODV68379.1 DUF1000-domain-containing protein [Hyphopichia burtonii NRRL Y-1933]